MEDGSVSHVELKVNATFGDDQVERQRNFVEVSKDEIIYILLGTQQFMADAQMKLNQWDGACKHELLCSVDGVITLGPKERFYQTSPKRLDLDGLISVLLEAEADMNQPAIKELAVAYRSCLQSIRQTFKSFVTTEVALWSDASWIGFYDFLRASRFPSGSLDSRIGIPHFIVESHPLLCRRLAADDFIEYWVHLDACRGEFSFRLSVAGECDVDFNSYVRERFRNLLEACAERHGLPLQWTAKRVGQQMTIATLGVGDLHNPDSHALGWEQCMSAALAAASAISDAAAAFRSSQA